MSEQSRDDESWSAVVADTLRGGPLARAVPIVVAVLLLALPVLTNDPYWVREVALIAVLALVTSGLNLSLGYAGELQFGQVFIFGSACYLTMIMAKHGLDDIAVLVLVGGAFAAGLGALIALPALRFGGWALALTTLFLVTTMPAMLAIFGRYTGGLTGLVDIPAPRLLGHPLGSTGLFEVTIVVAIAWFAFLRNLVTSWYGLVFAVVRESPELARSVGLSPFWSKVTTYTLGAIPAGLAGCLFGFISLVIAPTSFGITITIGVVAASILGGSQSVYGALVGAAILQLGPQRSLSFEQYAPIGYGLFLILAAITFQNGLAGLGRTWARRQAQDLVGNPPPPVRKDLDVDPRSGQRRSSSEQPARRPEPSNVAPLRVHAVSVTFGSVPALCDVSVEARPGQVTALIGANGSGKTTLLNVITGYTTAGVAGQVTLGDDVISSAPAHQVARAGVARTFQTPTIPRGVSVLDVVTSGQFAVNRPHAISAALRLPRYRRAVHAARQAAWDALELVGLCELAGAPAAAQSLGRRRLVELARAVCAGPRVLLLDEPAAGLSADEIDRLGGVIAAVARTGAVVVVVEHNIGFIAEVADVAYALHLGTVIARGPAATISADAAVIENYLGVPAHPADVLVTPHPVRPSPVRPRPAYVLDVDAIATGFGDLRVLHEVSLRVPRGTVEVVLGRNGVGKTTLLAAIAGLNPLHQGTVALAGVDVGALPAYRRAALGIALVQEGKRVFRERTVRENIALGTFTQALSRRERAALCAEVLDQFPVLAARADEVAGQLSGGQQQMLAIGQALAARPKVLLLDEPSSGLAPSVVTGLFEQIRRLSDAGTTVVLVEQLVANALDIADHVTVLDAGMVVSAGAPDSFGDGQSLRNAYFGRGPGRQSLIT